MTTTRRTGVRLSELDPEERELILALVAMERRRASRAADTTKKTSPRSIKPRDEVRADADVERRPARA